jgi:hypothetical protein
MIRAPFVDSLMRHRFGGLQGTPMPALSNRRHSRVFAAARAAKGSCTTPTAAGQHRASKPAHREGFVAMWFRVCKSLHSDRLVSTCLGILECSEYPGAHLPWLPYSGPQAIRRGMANSGHAKLTCERARVGGPAPRELLPPRVTARPACSGCSRCGGGQYARSGVALKRSPWFQGLSPPGAGFLFPGW